MNAKDWGNARASDALIEALRAAGHTVETPVTGSVLVDGVEITPDAWERLIMAWDGTEDGLGCLRWLEWLGWEPRELTEDDEIF